MGRNLTKKTMGGFVWLMGVKMSNAIFQFGILAVLARLLSPAEFGLMGLALIVVSFSDIFNDLGFGPAITQKKDLSQIDIHTGFTYSIIFGFILLGLLWLLAPLIAGFFKNENLAPILRAISFVLLLNAVITTPLGLMYREMEYKKLSLIQITSYVLGYGLVGILLASRGFGVWSLVIAVLSQTTISMMLYLYFSKGAIGISFNRKSFKELIHFGGGYSLSKIFSYASNKGDRIVVGRVLGIDALGLYERGFQIVKYASSLFGEVIDKVLFSPIAKKQNERELVGKIYLELTYILAVVFFPFSIFLFNNAKPIVHILLGDQWDNSIIIVQIMSVSVFFLICTRIGSTVAKSLGDVYRRAYRTLYYAIYIVIGTYIGSKWGVEGATLAVSLGTIINYLLAFTQVHSLTKVTYKQFFAVHDFGVLLLLAYQLIYFAIDYLLLTEINNDFVELGVGIGVLLAVYTGAVFLDHRRVFRKYYDLIMKKNR